jgi:hypothetical protein
VRTRGSRRGGPAGYTARSAARERSAGSGRVRLLAEVPVDRSPAHAKCSANLGKRVLAGVVHLPRECEFRWRHTRWSAACTSSGSRRSQSCQSALANDVALKLGQSAEDVEDQLASRRRGIDVLLQAAEANVAALDLGDGVDQMPQRASQPIQFPDHECVTWPQLVENVRQRWALIERTTSGIGEDAKAAGSLEGVMLQVRVLVGSGHTRVPEQVRHRRRRSYQKRSRTHVLRH